MDERIKKLRKTLDLTQQAFADRLGIRQNTIAKYETGRGNPTTSVISLICKEFNVNEDWLRTGDGEMFIESDNTILAQLAVEYNMDSFEKAMVSNFLKMKPEQRKAIKQYVKSLLNEVENNPAAPVSAPVSELGNKATAEPEPQPDVHAELENLKRKMREMERQKEEDERQKREMAEEIAALREEDDALERSLLAKNPPSHSR